MMIDFPLLSASLPDVLETTDVTTPALEPLASVQVSETTATIQQSPSESIGAPPKDSFLTLLYVLILATFVGLLLIRNVSRLLHTPLMSLTNAISAIAIVGSLILAGHMEAKLTTVLGTIAIAASMTNIVSGFILTDRMLKMFKKKENKK